LEASRPGGALLVVGDEETLPLFRSLGARVRAARGDGEVLRVLREEAERGGTSLVIILKHVVDDEERVKREARRLGLTVLVLPTRWAPAEPIDINRLVARALGIG
jgi:V/A-type H+-transporting ATPase subunit F